MSGIQRLLDGVEWKEIKREPGFKGELFATHEGVLKIADFEFKVYKLNDGQRVLDADDVQKFFS